MPGNEDSLSLQDLKRMKSKKITVVGAGSTGSLTLGILAKLGVDLTIIDRDVVEEQNISHQILYEQGDVGKSKARVASEKLSELTKTNYFFDDLTFKNAQKLLDGADLIIDCTDNTEARLLINDHCKKNHTAWIHTAATKNLGVIMLITTKSPCYECVFSEKHGQTCDTQGVMPGTLSAVASIACAIAIECLAKGKADEGLNRVNSQTCELSKFKIKKNPSCHACSGKYDYLTGKKSRLAAKVCGSNKYLIDVGKSIDLKRVSKHLRGSIIKVTNEAILAKDLIVMANGRILVSAGSEKEARKKYSRLLGF